MCCDADLMLIPSPLGARRPCHRHRRLPQPGRGVAGRRRGWWPCDLHQGVSVSPDLSPAHRRQHGPSRTRADGVCWEREHGEELGAAQRKVSWLEKNTNWATAHTLGWFDSLKDWLKALHTLTDHFLALFQCKWCGTRSIQSWCTKKNNFRINLSLRILQFDPVKSNM